MELLITDVSKNSERRMPSKMYQFVLNRGYMEYSVGTVQVKPHYLD